MGFMSFGGNAPSSSSHIDRERIGELVARAYENIHGAALPNDPDWRRAITSAAQHLAEDDALEALTERDLVHVFMDMIRLSEAEYHQAQKHLERATSSLFLCETAKDAWLAEAKEQGNHHVNDADSQVVTMQVSHSGTLLRAEDIAE